MDENGLVRNFLEKPTVYILPTVRNLWVLEVYASDGELRGRIVCNGKEEILEAIAESFPEEEDEGYSFNDN